MLSCSMFVLMPTARPSDPGGELGLRGVRARALGVGLVGVTSNVLVVMPALMSYECYDGHRTTGLLTAIRAARSYATTTLTQREVCPTTGRENNSPTSGCRNDPKLTRLPTCTPCVHTRAHVHVSSPS